MANLAEHMAEQDRITEEWEAAHPAPDHADRIVTRCAPAWAWDLIDETLALDARSKAADAETRRNVRAATMAMMIASEDDDGEPLTRADVNDAVDDADSMGLHA